VGSVESPYDWLSQVKTELLACDEVPLMGETPDFPWEDFNSRLSQCFKVDNIKIAAKESRWRSADDLFAGLGDDLQTINVVFSPIEGCMSWLMSAHDFYILMTYLLFQDCSKEVSVQDEDLRHGIYRFLALEVIHTLDTLHYASGLAARISADSKLPVAPAFCIDVSMEMGRHTSWGRLVIQEDFRKGWKKYFTLSKPLILSEALAEKIDVVLSIEAGKVQMSLDEWTGVSPGDCIILDTCSLEPGTDKDTVVFTLNGKPFYRGRLTEKGIEILEVSAFSSNDSRIEEYSDSEIEQSSTSHILPRNDIVDNEDSDAGEDFDEEESFDDDENSEDDLDDI